MNEVQRASAFMESGRRYLLPERILTYNDRPVAPGPFFDGRIAPGFGGATTTTVDLRAVKRQLLETISALTDLFDKLEVPCDP